MISSARTLTVVAKRRRIPLPVNNPVRFGLGGGWQRGVAWRDGICIHRLRGALGSVLFLGDAHRKPGHAKSAAKDQWVEMTQDQLWLGFCILIALAVAALNTNYQNRRAAMTDQQKRQEDEGADEW